MGLIHKPDQRRHVVTTLYIFYSLGLGKKSVFVFRNSLLSAELKHVDTRDQQNQHDSNLTLKIYLHGLVIMQFLHSSYTYTLLKTIFAIFIFLPIF